jgi:regulator of RNase E activity RraB
MGFLNLFRAKPGKPKHNIDLRSYMDSYDNKPMAVLVDLGLAKIAPSPEYTRYIAVILPVNINAGVQPVSEADARVLRRIESECMREAKQSDFLYAGNAIVIAAEHMFIACYCREKDKNRVVETLNRICTANGKDPTRIIVKQDREWKFYFESLYPDVYRMQSIFHQEVLDDAKKHNDNGVKPRPVFFWLYFNAKEDAERCAGEAAGSGFETDHLEDMTGKKKTEGKPFVLTLKKEMPLNIEQMDADATLLIDLAKKHNGEYDGIEAELAESGK